MAQLVQFKSKVAPTFEMFEKDAIGLLKMMQHSGSIPSALTGGDVATALVNLEAAVQDASALETPPDPHLSKEEARQIVRIGARAYPLTNMLRLASKRGESVMWEHTDGLENLF